MQVRALLTMNLNTSAAAVFWPTEAAPTTPWSAPGAQWSWWCEGLMHYCRNLEEATALSSWDGNESLQHLRNIQVSLVDCLHFLSPLSLELFLCQFHQDSWIKMETEASSPFLPAFQSRWRQGPPCRCWGDFSWVLTPQESRQCRRADPRRGGSVLTACCWAHPRTYTHIRDDNYKPPEAAAPCCSSGGRSSPRVSGWESDSIRN